jgi:hypothetical protein
MSMAGMSTILAAVATGTKTGKWGTPVIQPWDEPKSDFSLNARFSFISP